MTKREKVRRARIKIIKKMIAETKANMNYADNCPPEYKKDMKAITINALMCVGLAFCSIAFILSMLVALT